MKHLFATTASLIISAFFSLTGGQNCNELFISEYVEGSHNNKAIEIYNPTSNAINLSAYRLTRWQNGSTTYSTQYSDALSGIIQPHDVVVVVLDRRDPNGKGVDTMVFSSLAAKADLWVSANYDVSFSMSFNGDDAMSLDKDNGGGNYTPVDIFGKIGERPSNRNGSFSPTGGWTDSFPYNNGKGAYWSLDQTLIRKSSVLKGMKSNPSYFNPEAEWDSLPENTFSMLGAHTCDCKTMGLKEYSKPFFRANPNPVKQGNPVAITADENIEEITVVDMTGRTLLTIAPAVSTNKYLLDTDHFTEGIYFIKVRSAGRAVNAVRMVIQ